MTDKKKKDLIRIVETGTHQCSEEKVNKLDFKKTIHDSGFSKNEVDLIWDFYVTCSLSGSSGFSRKVDDYGWPQNNHTKLENKLLEVTDMEQFWLMKTNNNLNEALELAALKDDEICIVHSRSVMQRNCKIDVDIYENAIILKPEARIKTIFRHLRNSLSHGNTYFFDNGNMLLEDKNGQTVTAEILIEQRTLLDWIFVVDKDQKYYSRQMLEE